MNNNSIIEKEFNNLNDLENELSQLWGLKKASEEEKKLWKYKTDLEISLNNFIGENIIHNKSRKNIKNIFFNKFGKVIIEFNDDSIGNLSNSFWVKNCPLTNKEEIIQLHPGRKGKKIWSKGYYLKENIFKEIYYKTKEYRLKYTTKLSENFGENITSPIQNAGIKNKISNTIEKKYGVKWFLTRGEHYKKIEKAMYDKYGVTNLFNDIEWQSKVHRYNRNIACSKIEFSFCDEVVETLELLEEEYFSNNNIKMGCKNFFIDNKYFYTVDIFIPKYNTAIEFYGDYWHCNPEIYNRDYNHSYKNMTAGQIWEHDKKRICEIKNNYNIQILTIWEKDWKQNKEEQLNYIKQILLNL
jgi:hypothetical protein